MTVAMNVNRSGAFKDESFGQARGKAVTAFEQVFSSSSSESLGSRLIVLLLYLRRYLAKERST